MTGTPEHTAWLSMKQRCYSPKYWNYHRYGGRGIVVCSDWKDCFPNFYEDLGNRPSNIHSLDRIDNNANYSCGHCIECLENGWNMNCKWSTQKEQSNNRERDPKKIRSTNTTGFNGVSYRSDTRSYLARIRVGTRSLSKSGFKTAEEAHNYYIELYNKHILNLPHPQPHPPQ